MSEIVLDRVSKGFRGVRLFDDLTLKIEPGEFVGLVGSSGCGKSTLLNLMGLITATDSGRIVIQDELIPSYKSKKAMLLRRHTIGYLFQNYGLIDDEKVRWNLGLALEYKRLSRGKKKELMQKHLHNFGLDDKLEAQVFELSGGEQQRVAIIKLLLQGSQIILADEPTSGLDEVNQQKVLDILAWLNQQGKTIIMVTHNLAISHYFTRIIDVNQLRA